MFCRNKLAKLEVSKSLLIQSILQKVSGSVHDDISETRQVSLIAKLL